MDHTPADLSGDSLAPLLRHVAALDLHNPGAAKASLDQAFPPTGPFIAALATLLRSGVADGTLCYRGGGSVRYSRMWGASEATGGLSADAVRMDGPGPLHRHPLGEVDLCLSEEGSPSFDGQPPGWVVYGPGSEHVPTVSGGTMLILYLLPDGAIEFL